VVSFAEEVAGEPDYKNQGVGWGGQRPQGSRLQNTPLPQDLSSAGRLQEGEQEEEEEDEELEYAFDALRSSLHGEKLLQAQLSLSQEELYEMGGEGKIMVRSRTANEKQSEVHTMEALDQVSSPTVMDLTNIPVGYIYSSRAATREGMASPATNSMTVSSAITPAGGFAAGLGRAAERKASSRRQEDGGQGGHYPRVAARDVLSDQREQRERRQERGMAGSRGRVGEGEEEEEEEEEEDLFDVDVEAMLRASLEAALGSRNKKQAKQ